MNPTVEHNRLRLRVSELEAENKELRMRVRQLETEKDEALLSEINAENEGLREENEGLREENENLRAALAEAEFQLYLVNSENAAMRDAIREQL